MHELHQQWGRKSTEIMHQLLKLGQSYIRTYSRIKITTRDCYINILNTQTKWNKDKTIWQNYFWDPEKPRYNMVVRFVCTYQIKYWKCVIIEEHSDAPSASITMNNRRELYPPDAFPVSPERRRKACCNIPPSDAAWSIPHHLKSNRLSSECPRKTCLTDKKVLKKEIRILKKCYAIIYIQHGEDDKP
jgi:hypothetical protein